MPLSELITPRLLIRQPRETDRAEFVRVMGLSLGHFREWFPEREPGESLDAWFERELDKAAACRAASSGVRCFVFARPDLPPPAHDPVHPSGAWPAGQPPHASTSPPDGPGGASSLSSSVPNHADAGSFTRLVGFVNLSNVVRGAAQFADIGWSVSADATRRGVATGMVRRMLGIAFAPLPSPSADGPADALPLGPAPRSTAGLTPPAELAATLPASDIGAGLGLHRVQCAIIPRNAASIRVAEKCGFVREGVARKYLRIAGAWQDHAIFSILADDFPASDRGGS